MPLFTFYCLVNVDGVYYAKPYVNLYNNMVEIIDWKKNVYI